MEIIKDNKKFLETQKFFAESAKEKLKKHTEKREQPNTCTRPDPKDFDDFIEWWDAVEKWERDQKRMKKTITFN